MHRPLFALLSLFCGAAVAGPPDLSPRSWDDNERRVYESSGAADFGSARSSEGLIVATTKAAAVRSGLETLKQGGSAADAVLTHALAEVVLMAGCCVSHAGFLDLMYFEAESGKAYYLNAGWNTVLDEKDPLGIPGNGAPSGRTALVPGFMAGVEAVHKRFGKLPFETLFSPAIYFAEEGFELGAPLERMIDSRKTVLSRRADTKAVFTKPDGGWYRAGDRFRQPELAQTLRNVAAQGAAYMYTGAWGQKLIDTVQSEGGKMTMADLDHYEPLWSEPLHGTFLDYQVFAPSPPNLGGINMIEGLNLIELAGLSEAGHYTESPTALSRLIAILRVPDIMGTSQTHYVTPKPLFEAYAPAIATKPQKRINKAAAKRLWAAMSTEAWKELNIEAYSRAAAGSAGGHSDAVVAVDAEGNAAALLHTINTLSWGDTGIFVDGVAIADAAAYQQRKIAGIEPGGRLPLETNPLIIVQDNKPVIASSSIGMGVHEQTLQAIANILVYDRDPEAAVTTSQLLRADGGGVGALSSAFADTIDNPASQVVIEGSFEPELLNAVRDSGQPVKEVPEEMAGLWRGYWVGIHVDPRTGVRRGARSPHFDGAALGE